MLPEKETYSSRTSVDILLIQLLIRKFNNALLEAKHFACFVVNMSTLTARGYKIKKTPILRRLLRMQATKYGAG